MKTLNLVLHCGGSHATREEMRGVKTPESTESWFPIPHDTLVTQVQGELGRLGMRVENEAYGLNREGGEMFGILQVANGHNYDDYSYVVGIRNSHTKRFPAGLCVGSSVFVCDNTAFSSEIVFARRHTRNILHDLPLLVAQAVGKLAASWDNQHQRFETYRKTEIGNRQAFEMFIDAAEQEVFPWTRGLDIISEWKRPRHPEFKDRNVWSFFNSVTEHLKPRKDSKGTTLFSLPARTERLHAICDSACGIDISDLKVETN